MREKALFWKVRVSHLFLVLVIFLALFLSTFVFSWWQAGSRAEEKIIERIKVQELVTSRAVAHSLSEYFKPKTISLLLLAEAKPIKEQDQLKGEELIKILSGELQGEPLLDIIWVDKEGQSLWVTNLRGERTAEKLYLGDRDYFQWAKKQEKPGEVFVGEPLFARGATRENEAILVMASPVLYQEKFNGAVFMSFSVAELVEKFLTPLTVDPKSFLFLLARKDSMVVATSNERVIGKNISEVIKQSSWPEKEKEVFNNIAQEAFNGKEGAFIHPDFFSSAKSKLVSAYSPIFLQDQVWSLWVSLPYEEAAKEVLPVKIIQSWVLLVTLMGCLVLVLIFVFGLRAAQRDGFIDGFKNGRDGAKKIKG